jgi:hypothetical protein
MRPACGACLSRVARALPDVRGLRAAHGVSALPHAAAHAARTRASAAAAAAAVQGDAAAVVPARDAQGVQVRATRAHVLQLRTHAARSGTRS